MANLYVMARVTAQPDKASPVLKLLTELAKESENESGCLYYKILPATYQSNIFTTLELWESAEAEQQHWNTDHLKNILSQLAPLLAEEARIEKYTEL
ncbi:putative quinol monooxygenase [Microbulbifer sp. ANSA001]|uniref:putative quinol monooxygenase n=1 Tax=Microbulbifer sp. ANSA001 TaxID=3243358 RepID=UPI004041548D